jgi:hypothetical protein
MENKMTNIEKVLNEFDFETVEKIMKLLNWKWAWGNVDF